MQTPLSIPPIGQPWPGQGGTYAGVACGRDGQPDHHLIVAAAKPPKRLSWKDALAWAKTVTAEDHSDFGLPTRFESPVLFGNVGELFEPTWYWTSTQYSADDAFIQGFSYGGQLSHGKRYEGRVRAVRRLPIDPSILSAGPEQAAQVAA